MSAMTLDCFPLKVGTDRFVEESVSETEEPFVVLADPHRRLVMNYLIVSSRKGVELFLCVDSEYVRDKILRRGWSSRVKIAEGLVADSLYDDSDIDLIIDEKRVHLGSLGIKVDNISGWDNRLGFPIGESLLEDICIADKLDVRLSLSNGSGNKGYIDLPFEGENLGNGTGLGLILYSQCFYSAFYGTDKYPSAVRDYALYEHKREESIAKRKDAISIIKDSFVVQDYPYKKWGIAYHMISSGNHDYLYISVESKTINDFLSSYKNWDTSTTLASGLATCDLGPDTDELFLIIDDYKIGLRSIGIIVDSNGERSGYLGFPIDKALLERICTASSLDIHFLFSGKKQHSFVQKQPTLPNEDESPGNGIGLGLILYSQCFYRAFYGTDKYPSAVREYALYENRRKEAVQELRRIAREKASEYKRTNEEERRVKATSHSADGPTPLGWAIIVFVVALIVLLFFIIFVGL